jgi:hypothetical protein
MADDESIDKDPNLKAVLDQVVLPATRMHYDSVWRQLVAWMKDKDPECIVDDDIDITKLSLKAVMLYMEERQSKAHVGISSLSVRLAPLPHCALPEPSYTGHSFRGEGPVQASEPALP